MKARGLPGSAADIARKLDLPDGSVRKILSCQRPLRPEFLRDLGMLAGLPVVGLFQAMGWLPEDEVTQTPPGMAGRLGTALELLGDTLPLIERLSGPAPLAPVAAAQLVLGDRDGAERYDVRLSQVVSGERYRAVTNAVAEFLPRDGATPLPYEMAEEMAYTAGLNWRPTPEDVARHPGHSAVALELQARTHSLRRDGQEYSWQGGPGHVTWRSVAQTWPTHLLVQDPIAGRQLAVTEGAPVCEDQRPIVVVGGRHGTGLAAALLAEALGRQFVLVRNDIEVARHGQVRAVPPDAHRSRTGAWIEVARHIARVAEDGIAWPAVVLVRPAAFEEKGVGARIHAYALRLLRETPARIIYARTPPAFLEWWGARIEGDHDPGEHDGAQWAARTARLYAEIETVLAERRAGDDLLLRVPDPEGALPPHDPAVPAEIMDWTARVAWTAIEWLAGRDRGLPDRLRRGHVKRWRGLLAADPDASVPILDDLA
ncbi:hypothetical protein [Actinoallomurus sp. CA-150999]|uniref:hypothetical protein n=1 Tax=Actinoallomurus sp. CA-150999 TaxID=3239887 RepID=UPI003D8B1A56